MRYLKATAQDRSGNGRADTVLLHFYERPACGADELIHEAFALDIDADGVVDFQSPGDSAPAGRAQFIDALQLKTFANAFLKLNWFNRGQSVQRALVVLVAHYNKKGPPNAVELGFFDQSSQPRRSTATYLAAGYDGDGDGVLESFTNSDVDKNGVADKADKALLRTLCNSFLAFEWYEKNE
ncbi:hypothetical protein JJD66_24175 [Pseudomonas sp. MF6751]|uniref:hypothetical protein n=1 Tax=Pseudomonas sp. MF6751 TaxID=2797528 RepID=UPI00190BE507|nr:hypothetical protein [Pseudomonas sp. MF6751]MBK3479183.1 hypothetical protein [Pseudomonas sp. MF6751]